MFAAVSIATAVALTAAASMPSAAAQAPPSATYNFYPEYSGVDGSIQIQWESATSGKARVKANLKFNKVDLHDLKAFDNNCTGPVTEYKWHIHSKWFAPGSMDGHSAKFGDCAKSITGNHYDPYKICGPASEFVDTPACAPKVKDYKCTPDEYKKNFAACEAGDLSGKFGGFKPNKKGVVAAEWTDLRFPLASEYKQQWSIVLHAVCGTASPRVACTNGFMDTNQPAKAVVRAKGHAAKAVKAVEADDEEDVTSSEDDRMINVDDKLRIKIHVHHDDN